MLACKKMIYSIFLIIQKHTEHQTLIGINHNLFLFNLLHITLIFNILNPIFKRISNFHPIFIVYDSDWASHSLCCAECSG